MTSWTTPVQRSTGDLVTATIYNAQIIDNLQYLYDRAAIYYAEGDVTDVNNDASETTLMSFTLTGGDLGAKDMLVGEFWGDIVRTGAVAATTTTWRLKLGATTLDTYAYTKAAISTWWWHLEFLLKNDEATNVQLTYAHLYVGADAAVADQDYGYFGSGAEDTTGDLTVAFTGQANAASASYTHSFEGGYILLCQDTD